MSRPGFEPAISWLEGQSANRYTMADDGIEEQIAKF